MFTVSGRQACKAATLSSVGVAAVVVGVMLLPLSGADGRTSRLEKHGSPNAVSQAGLLASPSVAPPATSTGSVVEVQPAITNVSGGTVETTYQLPDGQTMVTTTPPAGFDPLVASASQLQEYGFPTRPTGSSALADWTTAMEAYRSDGPPTGALQISTGGASSPLAQATSASNWGGYVAGTFNQQNSWFVALKDAFTLPSVTPSCTSSLSFWIGLGGTNASNSDDLLNKA